MMKLCAIVLLLSGLIGGVEKIVDTHLNGAAKPEVVFSQNAPLAIPSAVPPDPERAVGEALADARGRELAISDLLKPEENE